MSGNRAPPLLTASAALAAAFLLSGCPSPAKKIAPRITPLEPASGEQGSAEMVRIDPEPAIQAARDRVESVLPEEKLRLAPGPLAIDEWAKLCGFTEVRLVPKSVPQAVELESPEGLLTLIFGQRYAKWNGIIFSLGFAAAIHNGAFMLDSLDVAKNIYPLAVGRFSIPKAVRVLALDPGHGGSDPGSRGSMPAAIEKDLTLDWALRIERLLSRSSWRVVLTRRDDRDVSLLERVAIADANRADLFLSLHFNALERNGSGREESGIETYCLTPAGLPSSITRSFEDDSRRVYPNNEYDSENLLLAMRLHKSLIEATGRRDRGVRRARFMTVLREQKRPAVLIEGGFLTSSSEAALILDAEYRQRMALAICNALPN